MRKDETHGSHERLDGGAAHDADVEIHPMAAVDPKARLGRGVRVGPFAVIGANASLGDRVIVHPHAVIDGFTTIGEGSEIFPGAAVGLRPQDRKYDGSPTRLVIGARTVIREYATLQPGTSGSGLGITRIGDDCLIMAYVHVAHDCVVGNNVVIANATQIAGHCTIEDHAILGGVTTIHQFVRVGTRAITGASSRVQQDIPPFMLADGHPARLYGLNAIGLRRAGFERSTVLALKRAYKALFLRGRYAAALAELEASRADVPAELAQLLAFLKGSERGVTRAAKARRDGEDEAAE